MSDEPLDWGAFLDQARKGISDFALVVAEYHAKLMQQGVPLEAATVLSISFQQQCLAAGIQASGD